MTNPHDRAKSALSAATTVIAAVLAILGGLLWALAIGDALRWIGDTRAQPNVSDQARSWFNAAALALTVVMLLSGATLLLARKAGGSASYRHRQWHQHRHARRPSIFPGQRRDR
jgi:H+/Cl- antiporter ClcA